MMRRVMNIYLIEADTNRLQGIPYRIPHTRENEV